MKLKYVFSSLGILICLSVFADGVKPAKVGEQSPVSNLPTKMEKCIL